MFGRLKKAFTSAPPAAAADVPREPAVTASGALRPNDTLGVVRVVPTAAAVGTTVAKRDPAVIATAGPPELETGGVLTIELAAIVRNWKALARRAVAADCAAVVKANAYGCGVAAVAAALADAGCVTFFVAHPAEAREVRAVAPEAAIYVLNGLLFGAGTSFAEINARPVIGSLPELLEWEAFRTATGWHGSAALHFDTGINRLGLPLEEASALASRLKLPNHGIALVMSHLACADTPGHSLNAAQIARYRDLRILFRGTPASLAASSGIFLGPVTHGEMVRPGGAIYGLNPTPGNRNPMEPVVGLTTRILQVRDVPRGATAGYGATWMARRQSRLAVVCVGYGDGYPRAAATHVDAYALIAGRPCPFAGRISMDLMVFDVTDLPVGAVRRGMLATLIGDGIAVDDVARWSGTIGYEVLTDIGQRYHRVWKR